MRGVLKALVAVELQLSGDLLLFPAYRQVNRIQDDVDRLTGSRLVCHDAVVVQIADPRLIFPLVPVYDLVCKTRAAFGSMDRTV